jgi:hypothetical protein
MSDARSANVIPSEAEEVGMTANRLPTRLLVCVELV